MANYTPGGVELGVKGLQGFLSGMGKADAAILGFTTAIATKAVDAVIALGKATAELAIGTVKDAISLESAFAGVIKTTDGLIAADGELNQVGKELKQGFRDLAKEIPVTAESLMEIGEIGGQLGVKGSANLLAFTETIAGLAVTTNLTQEEASSGLAQLANVMGTTAREGADTFGKLGSTIVALGNNFATTEADVLAFGQRIAGAGAIAGLTEADVFAIGAAMSSVGVQAEAGGTAVQKVLLGMHTAILENNSDMEIFAATAGMTTAEFKQAWQEDAGGAFNEFVAGLGLAGDDALSILSALGLEDQRLIRSFLSLANAGPLLGDAMGLASTAFEENTALTREAATRYGTTESQIQLLKNTLRDLGFTIGEAVLPFLGELLEAAKPLIATLGENLPGILEGYLLPVLTRVFGFIIETVVPAIVQAIEWFTNFASNVEGNTTAINGFIESLKPVWEEVWAFIQQLVAIFMEWWNANMPLMIETGQAIMDFWNNSVVPALDNVWNIIKIIVENGLRNVLDLVTVIMSIITGDWEGAWEAIKRIGVRTWDNIKRIFNEFVEGVTNAMGSSAQELQTIWQTNWDMLTTIVSTFWTNLKLKFAIWVLDTIKAGQDLIGGFITGVKEKAQALIDAVKGAVQGAIDKAKALLGIHSPSQVFFEIGLDTTQGLAQGILKGSPTVNAVVQHQVMGMQGAALAGAMGSTSITVGPNTITGGMSQALFEQRVLSVVTRAIGG